MKSTFAADTNTLKWVPNGLQYEFRAGDERLALLTRKDLKRASVDAETADGAWSFEREGLVRVMVTIYCGKTQEKVGLFLQRHGPQRRLLLLDGTLFTWKPTYERGRHTWKFLDAQDQCLFFLTTGYDEPITATVELLPFARNVALLPLLLVLSWYELWMECDHAERPKAGPNA